MTPHKCTDEIEKAVDANSWNNVGGTFWCPVCGARFTLHADESYDPETGEERVWFFWEADDASE